MLSIGSIYILTTSLIFAYTVNDHYQRSDTYFKAMMTYLADQSCVFVLYNMILSMAILLYRGFTLLFFGTTMEGEIIKIMDKLKNKIVDLIILAYIIDLKFDFEMYMLVVFVAFSFILHNHLIFRSEYLVHVYSTSTSLLLHYRAMALYIVLFFIDFQILKYILKNMLSVSEPTQGIFVYYMAANSFALLEPFMQFAMDFYEKYTFFHIKNSDEIIAITSIFITIPRLIIQLVICLWLSLQFKLVIFAIIRGFQIVSNIKKTYDSYNRIKKLSQTMNLLTKLKGNQLDQFHDLTCTVCYEDMKDCVLLPCRHIFHQECIRQWIIKNLNHFCPKCKHQLNFDNAQTLYKKKEEVSPLDRMRHLIETNNREVDREDRRDRRDRFQEELPRGYEERRSKSKRSHDNIEEQERQRQYQREEQRRPQGKYQRSSREETEYRQRGRQRISVVNREGQPIYSKQYVIDRPDLSEYPLEVYESLKKRIVPIGSVPYGMPSVAVAHRTTHHMSKRSQYLRQMQAITKWIQMDRNMQMMLL